MNPSPSIGTYLTRRPRLSGLIYFALILICSLTIVTALADIVERYRAHATSLEMLSRLEGRDQNSSVRQNSHRGSPFLEGQTVTVASAALLQRITSIITKAGGTVISSEIAPQQTQNTGYVVALANCELEQEALQKVLYEIEAGLPFLFVDQLNIQASSDPSERLRVRLGVMGPWPGGK